MAHWIDANVFMHAQNGLYAIDLAPPFWSWLESQLKDETFCSSTEVLAELLAGNQDDPLHKWAKNRKEMRYWKDPLESLDVQTAYGEVSSFVSEAYGEKSPGHVAKFLAKADAWIIAQAKIDKGTVVTDEVRLPSPEIPKMPNVCGKFDVPCITLLSLLRAFKFKF